MSQQKQYGKGISGFILGLLLATLIIAALVFLLNKNRQTDFKEPEIQREPATEVLTPSGSTQQASDLMPDAEVGNASDVVINELPIEPSQSSEPTEVPPAVVKPAEPKSADKPAAKPQEPKKQLEPKKQPDTKREPVKPTPQEILDNGNVEKAREAARRQAEAKEAERKKAQAALEGKSGQAEKAPQTRSETQGRVVLQAGSYGNQQAADAQRAKLAMLGVNSSVVTAEVNGKTMYRVQTGRLSAEAAAQTKRKLQQNGIETFSRQVK